MGHHLRRKFPAPASDHLACLSELTQTNSDSSASGATIESLRDPTANATPGEAMIWTNEKHNLYLDYLEASFVKQLHYSTSLRGYHLRGEMWEPRPTLQLHAHNSSHQFSALQDGRYQKTNDPLLDSTADSSDIWESPSHHFTSADKSSSETFPLSRETVVPDGGTYLRSHTTLGGCTTGFGSEFRRRRPKRRNQPCLWGKTLEDDNMMLQAFNQRASPVEIPIRCTVLSKEELSLSTNEPRKKINETLFWPCLFGKMVPAAGKTR